MRLNKELERFAVSSQGETALASRTQQVSDDAQECPILLRVDKPCVWRVPPVWGHGTIGTNRAVTPFLRRDRAT